MKTDDTGAGAAAGRPSKGQLKRETEALRELAKRLVALPPARLAKVSLGDELREGVREAQRFERGALARQLRYLTGLLREADAELIERELLELDQPRRAEARAFHQVEQWRDALVAGDEALLEDLRARFPSADQGRLRQLAAAARTEHALGKPSKSGRQLFRYLAGLLEAS
jgi:ribosome-associated protein